MTDAPETPTTDAISGVLLMDCTASNPYADAPAFISVDLTGRYIQQLLSTMDTVKRLDIRSITLHANITAHRPDEGEDLTGENEYLFIPDQAEGEPEPGQPTLPDEDDDFRLEGEYAEVFGTYVTFNADIRHTSVQVNSSSIDRADLLKILGQDADAQG
ncbi:hypothetical protein [Deinococcus aquaticus]|uniref:hypothetical protein n=1 Tax=Deinococcus aquaticus TaxID=328692 RepID=UPI003F48FB0C